MTKIAGNLTDIDSLNQYLETALHLDDNLRRTYASQIAPQN